MKVQIRDLYPNPYRDMDNYPINREKVDALKASIKQTGFWDNIVGRLKKGTVLSGWTDQNDIVGDFDENYEIIETLEGGTPVNFTIQQGGVEIAYGHHRLTTLKEVLPLDTWVDIPVKDLSDAVMIQIMANENMQEYSTRPATIDETVKVAKRFLEENPEEALKFTIENIRQPKGITGTTISKFLNWSEKRVYGSLERLNLIESGTIAKEAIDSMQTETMARSFVQAVTKKVENPETKKHEYKPQISLEKQREISREIEDEYQGKKVKRGLGLSSLEDMITKKKYEVSSEQRQKKYEEEKRRKELLAFEDNMSLFRKNLDTVTTNVKDLEKIIHEHGIEPIVKSFHGDIYLSELSKLKNRIELILNNTNK